MLLVVGVKGGVGTTQVALELARQTTAIALDLANGQLAAQLGRASWVLGAEIYQVGTRQRAQFIEAILKRRITLLWRPECGALDATWVFVQALDQRQPVVIAGGLEPPAGLDPVVGSVLIVTQYTAIARWHEARLRARFPQAQSIAGTREAAREWAAKNITGV